MYVRMYTYSHTHTHTHIHRVRNNRQTETVSHVRRGAESGISTWLSIIQRII